MTFKQNLERDLLYVIRTAETDLHLKLANYIFRKHPLIHTGQTHMYVKDMITKGPRAKRGYTDEEMVAILSRYIRNQLNLKDRIKNIETVKKLQQRDAIKAALLKKGNRI